MKITKFGHCCLLVEQNVNGNAVRVLTDPGTYTVTQNEIKNIDIIIITHEHSDHLHIESVKKIIANNPNVIIVTNTSVNILLQKEGIFNTKIISDGEESVEKGILIKGCGKEHAEIYQDRQRVLNTGYFIGEKLFYPGDAFYNPLVPVDILALPVAGPWCKVKDAINYFLEVKPKMIIPVHDGGLNDIGRKSVYNGQVSVVAKENGIHFINLEAGQEMEF